MVSTTRTTVLTLGQHRGNPRIYLEGRWLIAAGFVPGGCYAITYEHQQITLEVAAQGRTISGKKAGGVIDLNTPEILNAFDIQITRVMVRTDEGRIFITPSWTILRQSQRVLAHTAVSLFAGGGLLSQAAKAAGFETLAAVEINAAYADIYQANHGGRMYNCSVEEVPWDELASLAPIGLLEMGIPCEPFSHIRRLNRGGQAKRAQQLPPEAHDLGDMVYWALKAADLLNPHTIIIEEVPAFLTSGAGFILRLALSRMGYTVDARVINPIEYGALTARSRAIIVATTFPEVRWPDKKPAMHRLGDALDSIPDDSPLWFNPDTKPWVYQHWQRQTAKGNGFQPPQLTAEDTACPTIKKRYFAGQGDNVVVRHSSLPDHHRWLTLPEVKRLMGLPNDYVLGATLTNAGEVLGQGVQVDTFTQIIRSVTRREVPS
jgi:DNA (cytosine-5)-methyltransferase 1